MLPVSQCYMRIWMHSEMMCDYVSFSIKKGYWKGCPIRSERLYTNYCEVQGWKNFVLVSITKHPFDEHEMKYHYENICAHLKLKGTSGGKLESQKTSTVVHACTESLNKAYRKFSQPFKFLLWRMVVFIDIKNTCIYLHKEAEVSKLSWKKSVQLLLTVVTYSIS